MSKKAATISVRKNRNFIGSKKLSHIIWNENNPDNPWQKGLLVHHKDKNSLNDDISNLELMTHAKHRKIHAKDIDFNGENNPHYGKHHSNEAKEKISVARKEKYSGENHPMFGTHRSIETKKKLSEFRKGTKQSEETKEKIGLKSLGRKHTEETKRKISEGNKGKTHTEEIKKKLSNISKKWWAERRAH